MTFDRLKVGIDFYRGRSVTVWTGLQGLCGVAQFPFLEAIPVLLLVDLRRPDFFLL